MSSSGGLLDKAKAREDDAGVTTDAELVTTVQETTKESETPTSSTSGDNPLFKNPIFVAGIVGLIVSMVGFFYLKYLPGLAVLAIFLGSFAACGYAYTGGFKFNASTSKKWITLGVTWLLLAAVPYIGGANTGGNILVSLDALEPLDESSNTLNFEYYSSSGLFGSGIGDDPIKITIEQKGEIVWTGEVAGDGDNGEFTLLIDEFYASNALYISDIQEVNHPTLGLTDAPVTSEYPYTLKAESASGVLSNELEITSSLLTRTINDADLEMSLLRSQGGENEVEGVILKGWFGYMSPQFDGALQPNAVASDYTVETTVTLGETTVLEYPLITVDGTTATWDASSYGDGAGKVGESGSDFDYEGSEESTDLDGVTYFTKDEIYDSDGCYTFTVVITNDEDYADGQTTVTESVHYQWDGGSSDDEETLEEVSEC